MRLGEERRTRLVVHSHALNLLSSAQMCLHNADDWKACCCTLHICAHSVEVS